MASYLVLTPPAGPRNDEDARFIADKFSWVAFIFPALWLLFKRQWIAGIAVAVLQGFVALLTSAPGAMLAGFLIELALRLLVALEGSAFVARRLEAGGWTLQAVVTADDPGTAEAIYYQGSTPNAATAGEAHWQHPAMPPVMSKTADRRTAFGLFENYGER